MAELIDEILNIKLNFLNMALIGASIYFIYKIKNRPSYKKVEDQGVNDLIIPESRIDIDNTNRLSRYVTNPEYNNSNYLAGLIGSTNNPAEKINKILDIQRDIKTNNYNYMLNELARDDYEDTSLEQYRTKIFSEYTLP